jgi:hypothetical protein
MPPDTACPCCNAARVEIGEDRSERLDVIPAQYRVLVTRRPKFACRSLCFGSTSATGTATLTVPSLLRRRTHFLRLACLIAEARLVPRASASSSYHSHLVSSSGTPGAYKIAGVTGQGRNKKSRPEGRRGRNYRSSWGVQRVVWRGGPEDASVLDINADLRRFASPNSPPTLAPPASGAAAPGAAARGSPGSKLCHRRSSDRSHEL